MDISNMTTCAAAATEMELEALTDDLVTKTILMMPFWAIFKVRNLSQTWQYRFSPAAAEEDSRHDEDEKLLRRSFQAEVREKAKSLEMCFPVVVHRYQGKAYDWGSNKWIPLPSLLFLDKDLLDSLQGNCVARQSAPGVVVSTRVELNEEARLIVANIFTERWRFLPPRPASLVPPYPCSPLKPKLVIDTSTGSYNVIVFYLGWPACPARMRHIGPRKWHEFNSELGRLRGQFWHASVYDSRTDGWRPLELHREASQRLYQPWAGAYLNGVLYMMIQDDLENLCTLNLENGSCNLLPLTYHNSAEGAIQHLVVWNGHLFMVLHKTINTNHMEHKVLILKVHLESGQLLEVNKGPPITFNQRGLFYIRYVGISGRHLLFEHDRPKLDFIQILEYDLEKNEWRYLEFPQSLTDWVPPCHLNRQDLTFEPGFDPFWQV